MELVALEEVRKVIREEMELERARRYERGREMREKEESRKEERLFLVTFAGNVIGIPDSKGRAILTQVVYARVLVDSERPQFFGGPVTIVGFGDGRLLATPFLTVLTGASATSMVEVPESILQQLKPE